MLSAHRAVTALPATDAIEVKFGGVINGYGAPAIGKRMLRDNAFTEGGQAACRRRWLMHIGTLASTTFRLSSRAGHGSQPISTECDALERLQHKG